MIALLGYLLGGVPVWIWLIFGVLFPVANEIVQRAKWIQGESILQAIARMVLQLPVIGPFVRLSPVLGDLVAVATGLPQPPKAGLALYAHKLETQRALAAFTAGDDSTQKEQTIPPDDTPGSALWIPFILISGIALSGCQFCRLTANVDTFRCRAERVVTDCGSREMIHLGMEYGPEIIAAFTGSDPNAIQNLENELKQNGVADGFGLITCVINDAEAKQLGKPKVAAFVASAEAWKKAHPARVK